MSGFDKYQNADKLTITFDVHGSAMPMGTLAWSSRENRSYFRFDKEFIDRGLPVSPFHLPLRSDAQQAPKAPFSGIHGLFNDSLPDGWGQWLLDRRLRKKNYNIDDLTQLDRLSFVGKHGMGALRYEPEQVFRDPESGQVDLDWMAAQAELVEEEEFGEADIDRLHELQGSSGGARPKILIGRNPKTGRMVADVGKGLPAGFEPWIVKFRSRANDHALIGPEEYAYSLMAKAGGIDMPDTALLKGEKGRYFAVRRFDRSADGSAHIHTAGGLLHADHAIPSMDYETLFKLTRAISKDQTEVSRMFKRMVFNVLGRNRDDHAKNHAFEMSAEGMWKPAPAYDLTLSRGPNGQHSLAVAGEGSNPGHKDIMRVAQTSSVSKGDAEAIFQEIKEAVGNWPRHAEKAGLPEKRMAEVDYLLNKRGPKPKADVEMASEPEAP